MGSVAKKQQVIQNEPRSSHLIQDSENSQARTVIQTYRDTKISRKIQRLDPEVKMTFSKQFPNKVGSIQQNDTFQLSPRSQESECDWQDIYGERCFTLSDGHAASAKQ